MHRGFIAVAPAARAAGPTALDAGRWARDCLFVIVLLLAWFTVSPFPDLSDPTLLGSQTGGDLLGQVSAVLVTAALAAFVLVRRSAMILRAVTLPLVLTIGAFAISALLSAYPGLSARRLALAVMIIFQAAALLLLPDGREHFARLLAAAAIVVLAACFLGVALAPQLSIHQASDIAEPNLAGDWRGFFTHKNGAGASMVLLIFIGIFVARAWQRSVGVLIIVAAAVFLYFTHSKSPTNLLPIALLASYLVPRLRNPLLALVPVVGLPLLLNLLGVGSVMLTPIRALLGHLMTDPSYTGRDDIWRFALDHLAQRPLFGFGFEAFWQTPAMVTEWTPLQSWGYRASDAHNGFLNIAVTTGLVGLVVSLWWLVVQPFADYCRSCALGADRVLTTLFLQVWLFTLYLAAYESVFFTGGSVPWFLAVGSIIGLRFQTLAKTRG